MLTCKDISKLVSESLDRKLPFRQRIEIRMHMMMCSLCRAYSRQVHLMRNLIRQSAKAEHLPEEHLSEEARDRIKQRISSESE